LNKKKVSQVMKNEYKEFSYNNSYLNELIKNKRFGEKKNIGTYIYSENKIIQDENINENIIQYVLESKKFSTISDDDIIDILLFPTINEACKIIDEKICFHSSHLDIASCLGFFFH
jgi:enoyl-CoA hydratase/3-hydroxyacyl-CoA dehydrogenase